MTDIPTRATLATAARERWLVLTCASCGTERVESPHVYEAMRYPPSRCDRAHNMAVWYPGQVPWWRSGK